MIEKMNMHNRWNNTDRGKRKCSEKNTVLEHFAQHEFHINRPAIEPGNQWREAGEWLPRTWLVNHTAGIGMTVNSRAEPHWRQGIHNSMPSTWQALLGCRSGTTYLMDIRLGLKIISIILHWNRTEKQIC